MNSAIFSRHSFIILSAFIALPCCIVACKDNVSVDNGKAKSQADTTAATINLKKKKLPDTAGYKVFQYIKPQMLSGNKPISLYIFIDKQLTGLGASVYYFPAYHAAQFFFNSDEAVFNPDVPEYKHAILLLVKNEDSSIITCNTLDVPTARIDTAYLDYNKTRLIYLLTLDYSIGMGSYNGPASYFVNFADTGMVNYNSDSGFATTLKSAWIIRYPDNNLEVWSKLCRPDWSRTDSTNDNLDFNITTVKTTWTINKFKSATIVTKGFWENECDTTSESLKEFIENFSR